MRGFKAFEPDMTCRGMQYEVGGTYFMAEPPILCRQGYHFCATIARCFDYYNRFDSVVCEVESLGEIVGGASDKLCTNAIRIIGEASALEVNRARYGDGNGNGYGNGYGDGDGNGYGNGCGDGNGNGNGCGDGYGCGYGYGNGDGCGYGCGYGISNVAVWQHGEKVVE